MAARFHWKPSDLPEGSYIIARCNDCGSSRYPSRALMIEKAGDIPIHLIEPRVRCIARKTPRGPACGGGMTFDLGRVGYNPPEANANYGKPDLTMLKMAVKGGQNSQTPPPGSDGRSRADD